VLFVVVVHLPDTVYHMTLFSCAAMEACKPVKEAMAANGCMFSHQEFQQLWDTVEKLSNAADIHRGMALAFEKRVIVVVRPPAQRWGPLRSQPRMLANPVDGYFSNDAWKAPGQRTPSRKSAESDSRSSLSRAETAAPSPTATTRAVRASHDGTVPRRRA
jgi:hypothetical protein